MSGDCVAGDGAATSAVEVVCVPCAVSVRGCRAGGARLCRDDPAVSCSCPCVSLYADVVRCDGCASLVAHGSSLGTGPWCPRYHPALFRVCFVRISVCIGLVAYMGSSLPISVSVVAVCRAVQRSETPTARTFPART